MAVIWYPYLSVTMNNNMDSVAQIKFKNIPFYEVIDEVIKPTLLTGTKKCTLQDVPRGMKEATFNFNMSDEHAHLVAGSRYYSHGKYETSYQFQIRMCQLIEPVPNESPDDRPLSLQIRVNMQNCPLPPTQQGFELRRTATPINCTENVELSSIDGNNNIAIYWTPDTKKYVFAMFFVKKLTVDTLMKKLQDQDRISSEHTKDYIIKSYSNVDQDLATISHRLTLVCPLGLVRIKIPIKSIHCNHLQCFDAKTFILMNEKKETWLCPICNKLCLFDDLKIDSYFLEVVSSTTLDESNIEILADGTWRAVEETINPRDDDEAGTSSEQGVVIEID
ncbi:E3 SUMO-protein ligase PIAS1-like isoform X5 [Aphis gossypii]|uniref:E3 SUMO-protein ligase PIAS1-like isoform X4 n=1 Tax=Aphis gossypii TaxID=80765 RepID=UPI0021592738|nr:E3 SUMO-protein ligase PIAS1-like isoform X4 [Aphis gossypii]XP_050061660.1 E3 SUMO-protein ligase PIAS1-like isoform X5 [Aphis gossypii]